MTRTALITGASGQDASYLAEYLLGKGYEVHGLVRRNSTPEHQSTRLDGILGELTLHYGDVTDTISCNRIVEESDPDEIYNLAGQSHVRISSDVPAFTLDTNGKGVLNVLAAMKMYAPHARFYQASVDENEPVLIRKGGEIRRVAMKDTLAIGDFEALSHDGETGECRFMPVAKVHDHGIRDTYLIKSQAKSDIRVTGDHSVFVWGEDGQPECRKAEEIKPGDNLVTYCGQLLDNIDDPVSEHEYTISHHIPSRWKGTTRYVTETHKGRVVITPDVARLCGYYLAEGCCDVSKRCNRVSFTFGNHEFGTPCISDTAQIIKDVFGVDCGYSTRNSSTIVRASRKKVTAFFCQFGKNTHDKRLPSFIWQLPRESVVEFLRGYANDAKVGDKGSCVYSTASQQLQIDIAYLCRINGIPARLFRRVCKGRLLPQGTWMKTSVSYDVHVPDGYVFGDTTPGSRTPAALCMPSSAVGCSALAIERIPATVRCQVTRKNAVGREKLSRYLNPDALADAGLGMSKVSSVEKSIATRVMDFEVPGSERFFCGQLPVLAHNSSSEMFGNSCDADGFQRITTPMTPVSPYGCAKLYGYHIVRHYRHAYGMHCTNGVLFNHESPRRGSNFVTSKIVKTAVQINRGLTDKLVLGNLDAQRDWGFSGDYVRAMWLMLQQDDPGDWVVATGETRSVRDLCHFVFNELGMPHWQQYVKQDAKYMRANELHMLRGDSAPIRELGWKPKLSFEETIQQIIRHWDNQYPVRKR